MKKILIILLLMISCKSTESVKNNKLDIEENKTELIKNTVKISQLELDNREITFLIADPKEEVIFIDDKGKINTFKNVKEVKINTKTEKKIDSVKVEEKQLTEKKIDKSIINEKSKSISDTNNFKTIFLYIFLTVFFVYLVYRFKTYTWIKKEDY